MQSQHLARFRGFERYNCFYSYRRLCDTGVKRYSVLRILIELKRKSLDKMSNNESGLFRAKARLRAIQPYSN